MFSSNHTSRIVFEVIYWLIVVLFLASLVLVVLILVGIISILLPKGKIWSGYWAHTLAEATKGVWHWLFGPPRVRLAKSFNRRQRWRN